MPVLYSFFPAPLGTGARQQDLMEGSHYTDELLREENHNHSPGAGDGLGADLEG
jgi:hypothetical protein